MVVSESMWRRSMDIHWMKLNGKNDSASTPTLYLTDVWSTVEQKAEAIRGMLAALPSGSRIVIVGGSPCQDLTNANPLGVTGTRSVHFHIFPVLRYVILHIAKILGKRSIWL